MFVSIEPVHERENVPCQPCAEADGKVTNADLWVTSETIVDEGGDCSADEPIESKTST
jgi:hypothetical protein